MNLAAGVSMYELKPSRIRSSCSGVYIIANNYFYFEFALRKLRVKNWALWIVEVVEQERSVCSTSSILMPKELPSVEEPDAWKNPQVTGIVRSCSLRNLPYYYF